MLKWIAAAIACALATLPSAASAAEIFGGIYKHDVNSPLVKSGGIESGLDLQIGWRGDRIGRSPLQPFVMGMLNTAGGTSFAAAGLSAKFGGRLYLRPALGIAVHTGSSGKFEDPFDDEIEFGSRLLFAPEVAIGVQLSPRISAEASLIHLSHAQLAGRQNPGMDNVGVRVNVALP